MMDLLFFQTIADFVTDNDIERGSLYPPLNMIRECSIQIAVKIAQHAYEKGMLSSI